jgi:opacity protein-like surface antigen
VTPPSLLYVKGGAAWVQDHNILTFAGGNQSTPDATMPGWTAGGGLEYAIAPRWSIFIEYDDIGLETRDRTPREKTLAWTKQRR